MSARISFFQLGVIGYSFLGHGPEATRLTLAGLVGLRSEMGVLFD